MGRQGRRRLALMATALAGGWAWTLSATFSQPSWVTDTRVDPKDVMKQLTSVNIIAYCDDCRPTKGMVIVDNVVFEK